MTIKKLVKEIQKIYNRKIYELLEENAELKKEILALRRDVFLSKEIDKEKMYALAKEYAENDDTLHPGCAAFCGYLAGYRKAKEQ